MKLLITYCLTLFSLGLSAQVTLTSSPYVQTFDDIGVGLPTGWTVRTGATATALGTEQPLTIAKTNWNNSTGAFKNFASADGLTATADPEQASSTDRSLGLRQTGSFGNTQAAFVLTLANTNTFDNLNLTFKLQSLDAASPRTTTWRVDYGIGTSPTSFTTVTTVPASLTTGGSTFTNQTVTVSLPAALNNVNQPVYIRIITLTPTTGSGNRPSTGIDDVELTFDQVIGTDPIILLSTTARSGFETAEGTPSAESSYTVRGENLTSPIAVNAPAGFEISTTTGNGFTSSLSFTQSGTGQVPTTPIYVRLTGTTAGTYGGTITHSSTAAPQKNVAVDGVVNPPLSASTPIGTVRAMADGSTVTIAGRATVGEQFGGFQIFIQDNTGGISVFRSSGNMVQENGINIGDSVQVQGKLGSFNGLKQVTVSLINRVDVAAVIPLPKVILSTEILANEGQLVRINDISTPTATYAAQTNYQFTPVAVRIVQQTNAAGFVNPLVGESITSGVGYAIGIAARFNTSSQLLARLKTDLVRTGDPLPGSIDGTFQNANTLDVVCWNIEWFGSTGNGPTNEATQMANAKTIIETINADIYNLNEISDLTAFNNLVSTLPDYSGVCSSEVSNNAADGQRVCFVYKTALFTNVSTRHLLKTIKDNPNLLPTYPDPDKSRFWASGRLPFALTADVTIPGSPTKNLMFVGVHARANTSAAEAFERYSMRKYDVEVLRDSLNAQFPNQPIVMLGDFNDDLDVTVAGNVPGNVTSYVAYNNDPTHYAMLSRVLSDAGFKSTTGFSDMIDHIISSNELANEYINGSARVSNAEQYITNYATTTSDHYPVMLRFNLSALPSCANITNLVSPTNDISSGTVTIITGKITATNVISGTAMVNFKASTVQMNPGFKADNGTVFLAETAGCVN